MIDTDLINLVRSCDGRPTFEQDARNPNRARFPGCDSDKPLRKSPMSERECFLLGLLPLCCECAMHVWLPGFDMEPARGIQ